ncbi:protein phosphatase inhibitor 2 family member C [Saccopteryx leptura]|uniref:protein phosphatase inhibitor 2 family member C n=1 Tax=Saccopteryx leptura TaxID=249018 RepID=UPI00339BC896
MTTGATTVTSSFVMSFSEAVRTLETWPKQTLLQCQLEALQAAAMFQPSLKDPLTAPSMASSTSAPKPLKGILKNKGSTSSSGVVPVQQSGGPHQMQTRKSKKWDESNILATCHSTYKDYNSMKKNEPNTLHVRIQDGKDMVNDLERKDQTRDNTRNSHTADISEQNCQMVEPESKGENSSKIFLNKQEKQRQFELRRKLHHTEALNIKLARELIAKEFQCEEKDDKNEENPPVYQ